MTPLNIFEIWKKSVEESCSISQIFDMFNSYFTYSNIDVKKMTIKKIKSEFSYEELFETIDAWKNNDNLITFFCYNLAEACDNLNIEGDYYCVYDFNDFIKYEYGYDKIPIDKNKIINDWNKYNVQCD